ncbi:MAG: efflux RND transporter periplasmic adaptor subunit [Sphaerochaetaceae bacterium]
MSKTNMINDNIQTTEEQVRASVQRKKLKRRIKRALGYLVFLALVAAGIYTYQFYKTNNRLPFSEASQSAVVDTAKVPTETTVQEMFYSQVIDLSGYVEAYQTQTVVFRSEGAVTGVYVKEGDSVKKGDLLATIDDTSAAYTLSKVESDIETARLEGTVRQLELLEMQKITAENNLEYTKAYANFDGVVASVEVEVGDYSEAGDEVMVVIDRSKLKATVEIDEIDIQNVSLGMAAELTFDSVVGETIQSEITYIPMIGRYTTQGIGVMDVELTIVAPPTGVAPGFTFAGTIAVTSENKMLVVSTAAVTTSRGVSTVQKKGADGNAVSVTVTTKYLGEGMSQILSGGLVAGDVLLLNTSSSTTSGTSSFGLSMGGGMAGGGEPPAGVSGR